MADPHTQPQEQLEQQEASSRAPLLQPNNQNHNNPSRHDSFSSETDDTQLDQILEKLETFLFFLGFNQSSVLKFILSWTFFLVIGVSLPVVVLEFSDCSGSEAYQIKNFELDIVASQACLAAASLLCLSHNLRKYGIRKFLFVDRYSGHMSRFKDDYVKQIKGSVRLLVIWSLPCFLLKTLRESVRIIYADESWWLSIYILVALVVSWTYVSTITLSASAMFHMVCNLQQIHFDDYAKLMERESDVLLFIEEHIRLRYYLSKISHRFRIFLILQFIIVTTSQFITLFQTTAYSGIITIINGGDFAVSGLVQVVGIFLSLHAATKISHRAQGIASIASRWHALMTCGSTDAAILRSSGGNTESVPLTSIHIAYSESDLESLDFVSMPSSTQLASYMSTYHKRQAFVMYLQNNPGGITIFGWTVDRGLINTIFFIELSLVTFVLGKTIISTST